MDPGTITLDQASFKALASEVRVEVLKQLEGRRMTVTDLSHAMGLAKPTLLEHLDRLVIAGLVIRADEGRKWIYYELTRRGRSILHPNQVKIMISLALSILLFSAGVVAMLNSATSGLGTQSSGGNPPEPPGTLSGGSETANPFARGFTYATESPAAGAGLVLFAVGGSLLGIALAFWYAQRTLVGSARIRIETA